MPRHCASASAICHRLSATPISSPSSSSRPCCRPTCCLPSPVFPATTTPPAPFGPLPPERFLPPGRADLTDIDLDFDWKVRDDVLAYVFQRHGAEHTAMISSHLFLQPRSAFRESAKLHGLSSEQVSRLLETLSDRV